MHDMTNKTKRPHPFRGLLTDEIKHGLALLGTPRDPKIPNKLHTFRSAAEIAGCSAGGLSDAKKRLMKSGEVITCQSS